MRKMHDYSCMYLCGVTAMRRHVINAHSDTHMDTGKSGNMRLFICMHVHVYLYMCTGTDACGWQNAFLQFCTETCGCRCIRPYASGCIRLQNPRVCPCPHRQPPLKIQMCVEAHFMYAYTLPIVMYIQTHLQVSKSRFRSAFA